MLNFEYIIFTLFKAEVVNEDEKEAGLRAILNLGHSFGHAIETFTG